MFLRYRPPTRFPPRADDFHRSPNHLIEDDDSRLLLERLANYPRGEVVVAIDEHRSDELGRGDATVRGRGPQRVDEEVL